MGADIAVIDRLPRKESAPSAVDLRHPEGAQPALRLIVGCDVLIEGFRPGVMERLGLGLDECLARNEA